MLVIFCFVIQLMYCRVLLFILLPFYILISMYLEMMHQKVRDLSYEPNIYVSWSTSEQRVGLVRLNMDKPSIYVLC